MTHSTRASLRAVRATRLAATLLTCALASWAAQAQTPPPLPAYIGVSGGQARADLDCSGTSVCDRTDTAWKIFGGYLFHPNFGLQAEYTGQTKSPIAASVGGGTQSTDFSHEGLGLYALATGREGIWSVFGKAGLVNSRTRGAARVADLPGGGREDHIRFAWGAGVGVSLGRNFEGRVEFERLRSRLLGERVDVDLVTAGVLARF